MFKGSINENELSKVKKNLEIMLINYILYKNEYDIRRDESLGELHYAFRPFNMGYNISFCLDVFDKHYKGIKNFKVSWNYNEIISYDEILKIYNIDSKKQNVFFNSNFFKQIIREYYDYNVSDSSILRYDVNAIFLNKEFARYRIPSTEKTIIQDVENFFRKTHRMMYESAYIIENVKDFYI